MQLIKDQEGIRELINEVLTKKESEDLEFKHASGGFPGSFWDTYSAFANTEGGTIILGVEEKKGAFYLDILPDDLVDKYKKDFWNNVNNKSTMCSGQRTRIMARLSETLRVTINALRERCNACLLTQTTQHLQIAEFLRITAWTIWIKILFNNTVNFLL